MNAEDQEKIAERGALIAEITFLAYWVNSATNYCVFVDYSGHVDYFRLDIARSKNDYHDKIASTEFGTKYCGDKPWKIEPMDSLRAKRDHLLHILETEEIEVSKMEVVETIVRAYEF